MNSRRLLYGLNVFTLVALIGLCVAWELALAPLRPGGSWLVLKVLPLLAALRGILHDRNYTQKWATLMSLLYFAEGLVRAYTDRGLSQYLAYAEVVLAIAFFCTCIALVRTRRALRVAPAASQ